jgi:hypothetical protein
LGKLFARFLPIFGFVICGLPVLAISLTLGGIHPEFIFGATLVCLGVALVGGTAALVLSVFCTKTYEVLLVCYLFWIFYLLLFPLSFLLPAWVPTGWAKYGNPLYLCFAPYTSPGSVAIADFLYFLAGCIGVSAVLTVIAIVGLRRVVIRHGAVATKGRTRRWWRVRIPWLPGPSLDGNPVLWREWHRQRPSRWVRMVWAMYALTTFGFSLYCVLQCVFGLNEPNRDVWGILVNAFQVPVGLLLVSITSVTSLQDERVRDSLDVLLTTPLSTGQVYWGKWWGSYRIVFFLAALPTFVAAGPLLRQTWQQGGWPTAAHPMDWYFLLMPLVVCCYGSAVVTIGLALAIWIKRTGRAMATSVVIFISLTVGLLFAPLIQDGPDRTIVMGSSFLASGFLTEDCLRPYRRPEPTVPVLMLWCIFYTLVAAIISLAACRSFDRSLGRMPDKMPRRFVPERAVRRLQRRHSGHHAPRDAVPSPLTSPE